MPNIRLPFTNVRVVGHVPESLKKPTANQSANQPAEAGRNTAQKPYQKDISLGFVKFRKINPKFVNPQGETALHLAAEKGDLATIKHLLKNKRVDVNIQDRNGNTALHRATANGHREVVLALLSNEKVDPGLKNAQGDTALHLAVRRKHPEIARKLLEDNRLDPNQKNNEGETPLHLATEAKGNSENVELLLNSTRVDPNLGDNFGRTPLHQAARLGDSKNVELLLKNDRSAPGRMIDHGGGTPLHSAMGSLGNLEAVQMLLRDGRIDPNLTDKKGNPAILCGISAAPAQRKNINVMLADDRVNPGLTNMEGETLLLRMANCKDMGIVKKLLADDRVDPNGMLPLLKESPAVAIDMFKSAIPNLASHSAGADSLIKVLEYMADFKPGNAAPNRILTARTNFHLGQVLAKVDNPERKGECAKDAVFRFTLALEQLRNHAENGAIDIKEYAECAKALLDAAPDAKQFNLGGLPVLRSDIEDVAEMRGTEITNLKIKQNIGGLEANFDPNAHQVMGVHSEGFLLRGQELLKAIQDRNAIHNKQSAENGLKLALEKNVPLQLGNLNTDTETVIRELWTYIQNESEESKQESIGSFLNGLMKADKEKLSMEQVAKELLGTSISIEGVSTSEVRNLGATQLLHKIQTANQSHTRKSIQQIEDEVTETIKARPQGRNANQGTKSIDQVTTEIRKTISGWGNKDVLTEKGQSAKEGLNLVMGKNAPLQLGNLNTDTKTVIQEMWTYIQSESEENKQESIDSFLNRLMKADKEKLSAEQAAKELMGTSITIEGMSPSEVKNLDAAQLLHKIRTANQSLPGKSTQQTAAEITKTIEGRFTQGAVIKNGMKFALRQTERVNEGGLDTDVDTVMREMWSYIRHQPEELKNQLTEAFLSRLLDIGVEKPCNTGCVQRMLDAPAGIDPSLTHNQPDPKMIRDEIQTMAGQMNNDFEEDLRESYPSSPSQASSSQDDGEPNDDDIVAEVKKDLLSAAVMERLVRQRGWDRKTVDEQLQPVLDSIKYL